MKSPLFVSLFFISSAFTLDLSQEKKVFRFKGHGYSDEEIEVVPGLGLTQAEFRAAEDNDGEIRRFYRDFQTDYEFILKGEAEQAYRRNFLGQKQHGRNFLTDVYQRWPNGIIPYAIGK